MNSTRFSALTETLFSSDSIWTPKTQPNDLCRFVQFLVFNSAFGRHRHWLVLQITSPSSSCWMIVWRLALISACVCRRLSWTPKNLQNGSPAVVWLSFWCSTRFTRIKCLSQLGETCRLLSTILDQVVYEQPLRLRSYAQGIQKVRITEF